MEVPIQEAEENLAEIPEENASAEIPEEDALAEMLGDEEALAEMLGDEEDLEEMPEEEEQLTMEVSLQEVEENLVGMPEEEAEIAEEVIDMLSEEQLESLLLVFGVILIDEEDMLADEPLPLEDETAMDEPEELDVPLDEEADLEDMPLEEPTLEEPTLEEPTLEEAMEEEPPPMATPLQEEMQALALGDRISAPPQVPEASETGVEDDISMEAEEGSFIINAEAVKRVGVQDLEERILEPAMERLRDKGVDIALEDLRRPQEQVQGDVDIMVSNGEYYIPAILAAEIGYDLLEKINKRGKAATEKKLADRRQPEQAA